MRKEKHNMKMNDNNTIELRGKIISGFQFSHEVFGEGFYLFDLKVERRSDTVDVLPILVSERLINVKESAVGAKVIIDGELRSYNKQLEEGRKVILTVFAKEIENVEEEDSQFDFNYIKLKGFLCKEPIYRKTPLGREVTDFVLAINRPYGKSDYIPCICWGRNARFASGFEVGGHVQVWGRIQSREYVKKLSEWESEKRVAYEVSVSKIEFLEDYR